MHKLYQTVKEEHGQPVEGKITGDIPEWVCGSLYRNGPGLYEVGEDKYQHMFDPLAMITRFHIENKKVTYQNRFLQSDAYKINVDAQRIVVPGFGTMSAPDPCKNIFQRFLSYFILDDRNDNTNVNIYPLQDELYASSDMNYIHRIDPNTLDSLGKVDLKKYAVVDIATAHAHYDDEGTLHNIGYTFKGQPRHCILKFPPKKDKSEDFPHGEVISTIKSSGKMSITYLHSFGMTENYYVYVEQPLFINLIKILTANIRGSTMSNSYNFYPNIKTRFRIINKRTGEEVNPGIRYETGPLLTFHQINAYEDHGHLVFDFCAVDSPRALKSIYLKDLTSEECEEMFRKYDDPEARRYVLPLNIDRQTPKNTNLVELSYSTSLAEMTSNDVMHCTWEALANTGIEFPQINYRHYNGKKYRYVYGVGWHSKEKHFNTIVETMNLHSSSHEADVGEDNYDIIPDKNVPNVADFQSFDVVKIDINTKTYTEWKEDDCYPSEPVFVPNPLGTDEDDGVILSAVNNSNFEEGQHAFLLVLDAKWRKLPEQSLEYHDFQKTSMACLKQNLKRLETLLVFVQSVSL